MQRGPQLLAGWMERSQLDQRSAAKTLGLHFTTLNKILKGTRPPGRETAIDIEEKTGIPVAVWSTRVGKRKRRSLVNGKNANVGRRAIDVAVT